MGAGHAKIAQAPVPANTFGLTIAAWFCFVFFVLGAGFKPNKCTDHTVTLFIAAIQVKHFIEVKVVKVGQ